ncbi:hypothetical protein Pmani_011421 [Petrolisthes manimaculis]|uniref:THAP-type domain-containing protein n=1 Tax=Petrolisthes manimaculis TaxID=1843537 RepID=A0AAE1Q047_9EUCA|nr:hypothetical protein Pmani_011421 [Petrolisthes manimaculis]
MPTQCCVPLCTNKGGHRFPKDSILRKKWIQAVKRGEHKWKPSSRSVVCPNHFDDSDYKTTTNEGDPAQIRRLKADSVPHLFPWKSALTPSQRQRRERGRKLQATEDSRSAWKDVGANVEISLEDFEQEGHENDSGMQPCVPQPIKESVDSHSQTDFNGLHARDFALTDDTFHKLTGLISYNNFAMNTKGVRNGSRLLHGRPHGAGRQVPSQQYTSSKHHLHNTSTAPHTTTSNTTRQQYGRDITSTQGEYTGDKRDNPTVCHAAAGTVTTSTTPTTISTTTSGQAATPEGNSHLVHNPQAYPIRAYVDEPHSRTLLWVEDLATTELFLVDSGSEQPTTASPEIRECGIRLSQMVRHVSPNPEGCHQRGYKQQKENFK